MPGDRTGAHAQLIGTLLQDRYRLDAQLGQGGMGAVYRAHDLLLDRDVAVKILSQPGLGSAGMESLLREARAVARLSHPNIVTIFDAGESGGQPFIIMELVPGTSLRRLPPPDLEQGLGLIRQVCLALEHAHAHGIVHGDLKPENVLVTADGRARLMDFGLARLATGRRDGGEAEFAGTVLYLAPEHALGEPVDGRADLYALGVMLYELTTGRLPFEGQEPLGVISQHLHAQPRPPSELRPDLPPGLEQVILRLLAKRPEERYVDAPETRLALEAVSLAGTAGLFSTPNNLPVLLSSFIGRQAEMAAVRALLEQFRLVTLTGPGGTGKTRLALEVASGLLERFPDGVWLVELGGLGDERRLPAAVAAVLNVREQSSRPLSDTLADYLHTRRALLLLDNCEHLVEACAAMAEGLLRASAGLRILATSREALGITGEVAWTVPSLQAPNPAKLPQAENPRELVEAVHGFPAVRLFEDRAREVQPNFALNPENALAVAQITHRLDGIPLAIELSAARLRALSAEQIAARLDDRFNLLTVGSRTALPRQQTLRAAIDWSYDLLPPAERHLLARLSVFSDGWTLEAAEAVCADELLPPEDEKQGDQSAVHLPASQMLDLLTRLVSRSMVVAVEHDRLARYRLFETIREYAREKLAASGEMQALQDRHLEYFNRLAEQAGPQLRMTGQLDCLDRLEVEHGNLRAALAWALERQDFVSGQNLAGSLALFWYFRGYLSEGRDWLNKFLASPPDSTAEVPSVQIDGQARLKALLGAGWLADESGREGDYYAEALELARQLQDTQAESLALRGLGVLASNRDEPQRAAELLQDSLALFRQRQDSWGEALVLFNLGWMALGQDDLSRAHEQFKHSLELFRASGDRWGIAVVLDALSYHARQSNEYAQAMVHSKESLALFRELGDKAGIATSLSRLGSVAYRRDDFKQAAVFFEESLALARQLGYRWDSANLLRVLGQVAAFQGDFTRANRLIEDSLEGFRSLENEYGLAWGLLAQGSVAYYQGELQPAAHSLEKSLEMFRQQGDRAGLAGSLQALGFVRQAQGESGAARQLLEESLENFRELGEKVNVAASLNGLGRIASDSGDLTQAQDYYRQALELRRLVGARRGAAESLEDLGRLASRRGQAERAASYFGAASALRETAQAPLPPIDEAGYNQALAVARAALDQASFAAAWGSGYASPWQS